MLCEDCGRNRAVVHITQIGPDGKIEKNLCEKCAAKYGEFLMENQRQRNVSMNDFLKGVFSAPTKETKPQGGAASIVVAAKADEEEAHPGLAFMYNSPWSNQLVAEPGGAGGEGAIPGFKSIRAAVSVTDGDVTSISELFSRMRG